MYGVYSAVTSPSPTRAALDPSQPAPWIGDYTRGHLRQVFRRGLGKEIGWGPIICTYGLLMYAVSYIRL